MSAILTLYKDSGRTQPLSAGAAWGANAFLDLGTTDITTAGTHPSSSLPFYGTNTGDRPASNIIVQAAPAKQTTATAGAAYVSGASVLLASTANLVVGQAYDFCAPITDPGAAADYAYPLTPTYRTPQNVLCASIIDATHATFTFAGTLTLTSADELHTANTLAYLGQLTVAPDSGGSPGVYGAGGASTNIAAGPIAAVGPFLGWVQGQFPTSDVEGTHRFGVRARCTSG